MKREAPISVVDYGSGNTGSLCKALDHLGADWRLAGEPEEIAGAERIVFPGVGSFGAVMERLDERGLTGALVDAISDGKQFLGICVGLQVLFSGSDESPDVQGLGIVDGLCARFRQGKVPQIGWNEISSTEPELLAVGHYYFVNSYYVVPTDREIVLATADYHGDFTAAVKSGNIVATQFHPEKSGALGLGFLRNWLDAG